jgi:hypothetical protein
VNEERLHSNLTQKPLENHHCQVKALQNPVQLPRQVQSTAPHLLSSKKWSTLGQTFPPLWSQELSPSCEH